MSLFRFVALNSTQIRPITDAGYGVLHRAAKEAFTAAEVSLYSSVTHAPAAAGFGVNVKLTIGKKLGLGFGAMIALIVATAAITFVQLRAINAKQAIVLEEEVPGVEAALRISSNINHSLSMHRGYMLLGLPVLAEERVKAWENIHADLAVLKSLSQSWSPEEQQKLAELGSVLGEFASAQQSIADVCQTAENEPAKVIFFERVQPIGEEMVQSLESIMNEELGSDGSAQSRSLLYTAASAEVNELKAAHSLSSYLLSGEETYLKRLRTSLDASDATTEALGAKAELFSPSQQEHFDNYLASREAYLAAVNEAIAIRSSARWNVAEYICLNEVTPLAGQATEILDNVSKTQAARLYEDGAVLETKSALLITKTLITAAIAAIVGVVIATLLSKRLVSSLNRVLERAQQIASKNLTGEALPITTNDEIGELTESVNSMSASLRDIIAEVTRASEEVSGAATEIAASSEEIASGMNEQSAQVTQVSSAVEEMSQSVSEVAHKSTEAAGSASDSGRLAESGGQTVSHTIEGMNQISVAVSASAQAVKELGKRGEQIGEIIEVINDIADQTNLLALNAAIEAARAGEHGRGFAVVADEVRKLADRTTKATEEIGESITAIQEETAHAVSRMDAGIDQVESGVRQAGEAGASLEQIVASSQGVAGMIQSIAAAAEQQAAASEEISRSIQSIAAITAQANEGTRQAAAAGSQLSSRAEGLKALVSQFRL